MNGTSNAVISLDSDEEGEPEQPFVDKVEFEDEEEEDATRPYATILQTLDLNFATGVLHLAVLPTALLKAEGLSYRSLDSLKDKIIFAAACTDNSIRLVILPLTPPSPASKDRADFRSDPSSANAGGGKWGETMITLGGHQKPANTLSITLEYQSNAVDKSEPQFIVASHSTEISGRLLLFRTAMKATRHAIDPFQSVLLSSPAQSISFNTGLGKEQSSHLLVADSMGVCRIYDHRLLIRSSDEPTDAPLVERGTWLLSLYAGFHSNKSDSHPQTTGIHAGFGRKSIIDAQWVSGGRAIIALLEDGEWAIWDIEGVGPEAPKGLLGRHGLQGGSKSEYSLTGYIDGAPKTKLSGPPQITASKFAPMTPGTRKSTEPFSTKSTGRLVLGRISVLDIASTSAIGVAEESVLMWYGENFLVIPHLAKYWAANARKSGGTGNLFGGPANSRITKLEGVNLQGERCSGVEQLPRTAASSHSEFIILGEHRYIIVATGKPAKTPAATISGRPALTEDDKTGGELDVVGIEQALSRMENGLGTKRKIFQT